MRRWDGSAWDTFQIPRARPEHAQSGVALAAASADQAWMFGVSDGTSPKDTAGFVAAFDGRANLARRAAGRTGRPLGRLGLHRRTRSGRGRSGP